MEEEGTGLRDRVFVSIALSKLAVIFRTASYPLTDLKGIQQCLFHLCRHRERERLQRKVSERRPMTGAEKDRLNYLECVTYVNFNFSTRLQNGTSLSTFQHILNLN